MLPQLNDTTKELLQCKNTVFDGSGLDVTEGEDCNRWIYDKSFYKETLVTQVKERKASS